MIVTAAYAPEPIRRSFRHLRATRRLSIATTFLMGLAHADMALADPLADAVAKIVARYNHILVDINTDPGTALRFAPGSYVHREVYDPAEAEFSVSRFGFLCTPEHSTALIGTDAIERRKINAGVFNSIPSHFTITASQIKENLGLPTLSEFVTNASVSITEQDELSLPKDKYDEISSALGPKCRRIINKNISAQNAYQIQRVIVLNIDYEFAYGRNIRANDRRKIQRELQRQFGRISDEIKPIDNETTFVDGRATVYGVHLEEIKNKL